VVRKWAKEEEEKGSVRARERRVREARSSEREENSSSSSATFFSSLKWQEGHSTPLTFSLLQYF